MVDGPLGDRAKCRGCGAPIQWVKTTAGKWMPLDYDPSPDGNVQLTGTKAPLTATVLGPLEVESHVGELWMPHHATCPDVAKFR